MSLSEKYSQAVDSLDESTMNECFHDDFKFTNYSQGVTISKSELISWVMSGDVKREKIRTLYENEEVGVEHSFVTFSDGSKQAVLGFFTFKDGKSIPQRQGQQISQIKYCPNKINSNKFSKRDQVILLREINLEAKTAQKIVRVRDSGTGIIISWYSFFCSLFLIKFS